MEENVTDAVETLTQDLITFGTTYNKPSPFLYSTTIAIIILIHIIYIIQMKRPRRNIVATYEQIRKKKFHKLIVAMFSHPNLDESLELIRRRRTLFGVGDTSSRMRRFEIDFGDNYNNDLPREMIWNYRLRIVGIIVWSFVRNQIIHPLAFGQFAGLPLLCYVSHIIWQCRPLEEVYDYSFDSSFPSIQDAHFNVTTIIDRDTLIRNTLTKNMMKRQPTSKSGKMGYNLDYYRVLFALLLCSYLMDVIITHLSLSYFKRLQRESTESESLSSTTTSSYYTRQSNQFVESLRKRGICTLTPLATALLVIYSGFFPHTPISVLPFVGTSTIFGSSSQTTLIACYVILTTLSYRIYPLAGVFYGSITGLFWTSDVITFLADRYWGGWCIFVLILACATSLKIEMIHHDETTFDHRGVNWVYKFRDWLSWIDYISWSS